MLIHFFTKGETNEILKLSSLALEVQDAYITFRLDA